MPHSDSSDLKDSLLRRAFGAEAEHLTSKEVARLASVLHGQVEHRFEPDMTETDTEVQAEAKKPRLRPDRNRGSLLRSVALGAAGLACGLLIGAAFNLDTPSKSPYLTNAEVRSSLPRDAPAGDLGGVDAQPPMDSDADPHSMVLNGVFDGNPAWTWTRQGGKVICYHVDLTEDVGLGGCADRTIPLTSLVQRSVDPSLTDPADLGTYTVTAFKDALPFITFTALD